MIQQDQYKKETGRLYRNSFIVLFLWIFLVAGYLAVDLCNERRTTFELVKNEARATFNKDLAFRLWVTSHGGVYVVPDKRTPPNPYLLHVEHRDIETRSGKKYTLMNPAYALRQIMNEYEKLYGVKGHITSLKALNPENAPDSWEQKALLHFTKDPSEYLGIVDIKGKSYMRLMQPLIPKKGCLKCHDHQGYKLGDILGGLGISIPMKRYHMIQKNKIVWYLFSHGAVFIIGVVMIVFFSVQSLQRIKEKREAQKVMVEMETRLRQAQKMESLGTLAGGVAHDFNNILSPIMGYTELSMATIDSDSPIMDNMKQIFFAANRARTLVKHILAFSSQNKMVKVSIRMDLVVKEVLSLIRASLPTTIEIRQNLDSTSMIHGDPTQIHQVIMNICTNAFHAMESHGGLLTLTLIDLEINSENEIFFKNISKGNYQQLIICDTGCGMDHEVLEKIFDPYFTTRTNGKGTGLGLSVSHGIVKSHNGHFRVTSSPGKGTTFNIFFPRITDEPAIEKIIHKKIIGGNEHILIVDDEVQIMTLMQRILEPLGYRITAKNSSIETLEVFKAEPDQFDLVITDMTMPGMTGDILAENMLKIRNDIPIIICTGFSQALSKERISNLGIKLLLNKPVVKKELTQAIRKVLDT